MSIPKPSAAASRYRLAWGGSRVELTTRRAGLRTEVVLLRDGHPVGSATGIGRIQLPLPPQSAEPSGDQSGAVATVLALSALPGTLTKAFLLVPKQGGVAQPEGSVELPAAELPAAGLPEGLAVFAGLARGERHPFEPPPGTLAARLRSVQRRHPRLYASRHVLLAVGKVALGLLGVALFVALILRRVAGWITERLPDVDLPSIPWPDIDLPPIPWPDVNWPELPDLTVPGWLLAVVTTAKYWGPILVAVGLAVREVRRRARPHPDASGKRTGTLRPAGTGTGSTSTGSATESVTTDSAPSDPGRGSPQDAHH